uniref:Uncharacterized protein n=1 Tax=Carnobacterium maltaromaticum TaxID=2751 RepID=A0A1Z5AX91_CARML|nr:hypothetical protein [Carnobacterium maltaromaticum]CRI06691.1 protein of unknown function [Carnobacterium maltaromaticum]
MNLAKNDCSCETCKKRNELEKSSPGKAFGLQYAYLKLNEDVSLLVSAEECAYLDETEDMPILKPISDKNVCIYTIAYGIFKSQTDWHSDLYDLALAKNSSYYFYDLENNQLREVKIKDYIIVSKNKDQAKVILLLKSDVTVKFPADNTELAITLSKLMPELGNSLRDLMYSRIEYGVFRLDKGNTIQEEYLDNWKKFIYSTFMFGLDYDRFLLVDE